MKRNFLAIICVGLALCFIFGSVSYAAEGGESAGQKMKNFWQRLFGYPAKVTQDSAGVVADAGKKSVDIVANEVKTVGQVTSGEIEKTPNLVTEPVKNTVEATATAVTDTANIPVEAAKE
jgi:hypothetical protein